MIIDIYTLLYVAIFIPILTLVGHFVIAYKYAPTKAQEGVMDSLENPELMSKIMGKVVENFLKPLTIKDRDGNIGQRTPIDLFSEIASGHIEAWMKSFIGGTQSQLSQELVNNAQTAIQSMPNNPMMGLILSQIPKKYIPYAQMLANFIIQNQQQ